MDTTLTLDGEMKLNLKMDSEFTGKHYTLDFDLNPSGMWGIHITGNVDGPVDAKWTIQKDYTMGEIVVKYKNQNYAFMQLKGNAEMRGVFPVVFDYVVKYNIKDAMEHQGKAKMKFDGKTPAKKFEMSFAPKTGTPMDLIWNMDFSSGFKYDYDFKMNAVTMEKGNGEYKWVNNGQKFELMTKDTFIVTKQSPFHWMNTMVTGGREWTKMDVVGNNPWMGDYKLSRQGEFEEVSGSVYKIKWTGHGETTKGFLRRVSPVETNVVASVNVRNMKVDAIVWKSFAGQKYGFTLTNDKFTLLAGKH